VGLGILLDTFVVRTVIIPALFHADRPSHLVARTTCGALASDAWKNTGWTPCSARCGFR
jgi:hypothetical protein